MEKVAGIGGCSPELMIPKRWVNWYLQHLVIALEPTGESGTVWQQEAGPTVFGFLPPKTSGYYWENQATRTPAYAARLCVLIFGGGSCAWV